MTTVVDRTTTTLRRTPMVEVIVGQELEGAGLRRLALLLDDALTLRPVELVVDLAGSRVLDAAALHVLLDAHAHALRGGGRLSLRSVSETHARNIALAGLRSVFRVVSSGDEALAVGTNLPEPREVDAAERVVEPAEAVGRPEPESAACP